MTSVAFLHVFGKIWISDIRFETLRVELKFDLKLNRIHELLLKKI